MLNFTLSHPAHGERQIALSPAQLAGEGATIGRTSRNHVVLDDQTVSRTHARITVQQDSTFITDCGSTSGTALNGTRLASERPMRMTGGDRITIGPFTLTLNTPSGNDNDLLEATIVAAPPLASYMPLANVTPESFAHWSEGELQVQVQRITDETPDVKTFAFTAKIPTLYHYAPGQFITLHLDINGTKVMRSYSLSSTPSRPHTLTITVKRVVAVDGQPAGVVSNWLHDHLAVGDTITISGPFGDFSCAKQPSPRLLLVSAGSGITPMLAMTRWLTDSAAKADVVFLHSARTSADIICRRELELMATHNPRLKLIIITTRPEPGSTWLGLTGRLSSDLLRLAAPDFQRRAVFCCGPEPFMKEVKKLLVEQNFTMGNYHEESFGGAKRPQAPTHSSTFKYGLKALLSGEQERSLQAPPSEAATGPRAVVRTNVPNVVFARSGITATCLPDQTILEAGEAKGVELASGCRMGKCGMCKQRKRSGEISRDGYSDSVLTGADRGKGYILCCIAKPATTVELDV